MSVRLGYAAVSIYQKEQFGVYTNRAIAMKTLISKGIDEAKRLAMLNIDDLIKIIQYNEDNGIRFYRMSSSIFPHLGNPRVNQYDIDFARDKLALAGKLARDYGHRITMHPGQFIQFGSPNPNIVAQSVTDIILQSHIFEYMGLTPEHGTVMIIHGGGVYNDKNAALNRWEITFNNLPDNVKRFIVLENDEFSYSVLDLLPMCEKLKIPLCIDYFHHLIGHSKLFDIFSADIIMRTINIWKMRGIKPKCHWSNQAPDARKGTHADCVNNIPKQIMNICKKYSCDIMIEAKLHDLCLFSIIEQYYFPLISGTKELPRLDWILKH